MIKTARKPSSDPVQEKLREKKFLWNKEVSTFINDLINFKKTMNGAPSKFHPEKGNIKEPIPADPVTIIGVLANDFQEIAQKGNDIISEQIAYAKNRRKSKPKSPSSPASNVPAGPDLTQLSQQLSAASDNNYALVSEGSNIITRFFTRLFNPAVGWGDAANLRRARMSMLNACADSFNNLEKFQVSVVKSSKESILESHKKLESASHYWNLVSRGYSIYKNSKSASAPDQGGTIELDRKTDQPEADSKSESQLPAMVDPNIMDLNNLERIKNMVSDYRKYYNHIPSSADNAGGYLLELDAAVDKFIASRGKKINADFEQFYEKTLKYLNEEFKTSAGSFKELSQQLKTKNKQQLKDKNKQQSAPQEVIPDSVEKEASLNLEKVAQDFLKKWIGKTTHQLSVFDQTSPFRLNCYKSADQIIEKINEVMDILEKGLDQERLDPLVREINREFVVLRGLMSSLYLSSRTK